MRLTKQQELYSVTGILNVYLKEKKMCINDLPVPLYMEPAASQEMHPCVLGMACFFFF